jgi:hypothetical protein
MKKKSHRKIKGKEQQQASSDTNGIVSADKEKPNPRSQSSPIQR